MVASMGVEQDRRSLDGCLGFGDDAAGLAQVRSNRDGIAPLARSEEAPEFRPQEARPVAGERHARRLARTAAERPDVQAVSLDIAEDLALLRPQREVEELRIVAGGEQAD